MKVKVFYFSIIIMLGLCSYSLSFKNNFVGDDVPEIIQDYLSGQKYSLKNIFFSPFGTHNYRPLRKLSALIDTYFWGLNPWGYHLTNVSFHILNALLIYSLATFLFKAHYPALLAGSFFVLSPLHSEVVYGISFRADALTTFFYLFSLLLFLKTKKSALKSASYYLSLFCFLLSLLSKGIAVTLPLILIAFYLILPAPPVSPEKFRWKRYLPFLSLSFLYLICRKLIVGHLFQRNFWGGTFASTFSTMQTVMVKYLALFLFPFNLHLEYEPVIYSGLFDLPVIASFVILTGLFISAIYLIRRKRVCSFCILWFFITLIPSSNLIPIAYLIAERYLYLPSIGLFLLLGYLIWQIKANTPAFQRVFDYSAIAILICFFLLTLRQRTVWKDNLSLWKNAVRYSPASFVAHLNLGTSYFNRKLFDLSAKELERATRISPQSRLAWFNLGNALAEKGEMRQAATAYRKSLQIDPQFWEADFNLGTILYQEGSYNAALVHFHNAWQSPPPRPSIAFYLGLCYEGQNEWEKARDWYRKVLELAPGHPETMLRYQKLQNKVIKSGPFK